VPAKDPDVVFILVAVPPSLDAPHAQLTAAKDDVWFRFPVRHESTTRFLAESELAARYEQRQRSTRNRWARIGTPSEDRFSSISSRQQNVVRLAIVTVPINVGAGIIDNDVVTRWERRGHDFHRGTWSFGIPPSLGTVNGVQIIQRGARFGCVDGTIEVHTDGATTFAFAMSIAAPVLGLERVSPHATPVDSDFLFARLSAAVAYGAAWATEGCGAVGDMLVAVRLDTRGSGPGHSPAVLTGVRGGSEMPVALVHAGVGGISCQMTTSMAIHGDPPNRAWLIEANRLLSEVTQSLGLIGPQGMTADGTIDLGGWKPQWRDSIARWSQDHEIGVT
jgi:hypothetical protein